MLSMLIDHISMCIILAPVMIVMMIILVVSLGPSYQMAFYNNYALSTISFLPFIVYFLKDNYRGKSIGKRLMGYQVVTAGKGNQAGSLRCFIRNLLILIWPLEALITLFSPSRRLGDLISGTKVIISEKEPINSILPEIRQTKFGWKTLLILAIGLGYGFLLARLMFGSLPF